MKLTKDSIQRYPFKMGTSDQYHFSLVTSFPIENLPNYSAWTCDQWVDFHKRLKARYGKSNANKVWSQYFNNKPSGWLGEACVGDDSFRSYFKGQGITFDNNYYSYVNDVTGFLSNLPDNIRTAVTVTGVVVGVLVVGLIAYQIYNAATLRKIAIKGLKGGL